MIFFLSHNIEHENTMRVLVLQLYTVLQFITIDDTDYLHYYNGLLENVLGKLMNSDNSGKLIIAANRAS